MLALAGVVSAPALAEDSVLKAVVNSDLENIDPIWTTANISRNHGNMAGDTLFAIDEKSEIQPRMAESATVSEDGMTYTIKLRPGLKWHDGGPVTPEDCIASIRRWGQRDGMGQQMMAVVESMEAVDDLTFTIKLKEVWGLVLPALGKMSSNGPFMMPKRLAETDPFEQVPGAKVVYDKNQAYVPRGEPASGAAGGKVARQAIQLVVDQETYLQAIVGTPDQYEICPAMFMCDTPYATDVGSERVIMQDFDKAKAMLAEAGYNGETIVLMHPTDIPTLNAATQVTAQLLREAGINLEVHAMDWSTLTSRRAEKKAPQEGGWHIFHTSWIAPDLVNPVANICVSGGGTEKAWFGWPTDPEIEALRTILVGELNEDVNSDWVHCGSYPFPCPPPPCPKPCPLPPPCPKCPPCPGPWCPYDRSIGDYGNLFDRMTGANNPPGLARHFNALFSDGGRL